MSVQNEPRLRLDWVCGDGGPLIAMEAALLNSWEGSDVPSGGRVVEAEFRWGSDVATDYDLACDVSGFAGVIRTAQGQAFVLSTDGSSMATWLSGFGGFAGALVEWNYADNEGDIVEQASILVSESSFSQVLEFGVASSPLVLFVAAERGHDDCYPRHTFELVPGFYTVRTGQRATEKTSVVCHVFELKPTKL